MILTDKDILDSIKSNKIKIEPFDLDRLGSNSYDVTLFNKLAVYKEFILDCKKDHELVFIDIPEEGYLLKPKEFYLGSINEKCFSEGGLVPMLEGKSSLARL
jgi:dCTP deaminase